MLCFRHRWQVLFSWAFMIWFAELTVLQWLRRALGIMIPPPHLPLQDQCQTVSPYSLLLCAFLDSLLTFLAGSGLHTPRFSAEFLLRAWLCSGVVYIPVHSGVCDSSDWARVLYVCDLRQRCYSKPQALWWRSKASLNQQYWLWVSQSDTIEGWTYAVHWFQV
jgi:hypothetical protein